MKATYGEITEPDVYSPIATATKVEARPIFKDPITDDGTKKSKKGLLSVHDIGDVETGGSKIVCNDEQTWEEENQGLLTTVFLDGSLIGVESIGIIRERLKNQ